MDLARLSEFVVIAEEGSFRKAAERLGLAPNVLTTRFQSFESTLNQRLIERNAHHFQLTKQGLSLIKEAPQLLDSYEKIVKDMKEIRGTAFQSLTLQLCAQTMAVDLGPFLDRYCRKYPRMFLNLYDENNGVIRDGLHSGEIDVSFAVGREDDFTDISGRIALHHFSHLKVHVPTDHRLAKRSSIRFAELDGETFLLYPKMKEPCTRQLQLRFLEQSGIRYQIYDGDYTPYFYDLLVPIGKGVRLWSWNDRTAPNTSLLTIRDKGYETVLFMLYDRESENPAVPHFIESFMKFREARR